MRQAYRVICHIIAACVVIQAAAIAWATFAIGEYVGNGKSITDSTDFAGFDVHSVVGQFIIPLLAIVLFVMALIARVGIKWSAWLLLAVVVQIALAFASFAVSGLGILHGIGAFVVLGLAEVAASSVGRKSAATGASQTGSAG